MPAEHSLELGPKTLWNALLVKDFASRDSRVHPSQQNANHASLQFIDPFILWAFADRRLRRDTDALPESSSL